MFKEKDQSWTHFAIEISILLVIVLSIRFYVFQFFRVSGPSMCPTLNQLNNACETGKGEFIFVNEFLYHFIREPKRGEIAVFRPPNEKVYYIKRIIGLPGDIIEIEKGRVYLTNENHQKIELPETYLSARNQGRTFAQQDRFEVPAEHYVLFGDNRSQSLDARQCFGSCFRGDDSPYTPIKNIKGRSEFVIWPFWTTRWTHENPLKGL